VKEIGRKFNFWAEQTISTVFSASCRKLGNTNDSSSYLFSKKIRVDNMQKQKKKEVLVGRALMEWVRRVGMAYEA